MPVMPGDDHPNAEPSADPRRGAGRRTAARGHRGSAARVPAPAARGDRRRAHEVQELNRSRRPSAEVQPAPAETTQASGEVPEPEKPPRPEPALGVSDDEDSEPPDARTVNERIERLDKTLARISAMLPLLRGETKRGSES